MATRSLPKTLSRSLSTSSAASSRSLLRHLAGAAVSSAGNLPPQISRSFSANATTSSLRDSNPNGSNRPPKETITLDGCDFEHWLVMMEPPEEGTTRDDIIKEYIKTLATVVGSEEEARMKIYSVSTRCYFAFGALVSEELSYKLKDIPKVRWVLPDSYLDVKNKDYGGEPFINGEAVPYDPKYHEEWMRNNSRPNERNRRNDRPKNFDNSRTFNNSRENMQRRDIPDGGTGGPSNNTSPSANIPPPPVNRAPPQMCGQPRAPSCDDPPQDKTT